ncbi:hypothetical protein LVJ94_35230 [Pendulispora rubella]|uniref:DNA-directed RNA polymerase n=1 Tax=Pendulispora rubella TaxID=2741070 RepID=A0ABZ2KYS1_9BACT
MNGQEYQVDSQWQLRPGVYTRRRNNGELETTFNVLGKRSFDVILDPETKVFQLEYGKTHVPIYPILRTLGADDAELERAWGKDVAHANKNARLSATALERMYKADRRVAPPSREAAAEHVFRTMAASRLRPDATELTLGKPFTNVTGEALRIATEKMLRVQNGHAEDDRDSLLFKDLRDVGDYAYERLTSPEQKRALQLKALRKVNSAKEVGDVWKSDFLTRPIKDVFLKNAAARTATQINPLEMISSAQQTTLLGPGGIQSERSITDEAKFVNPSHLGFLDPIHTPEGTKTGVTLRLPLGLHKEGANPTIAVYDRTTKRHVRITPREFMRSKVVLPDQVRWEDGHPAPLTDKVKIAGDGNTIRDERFDQARYVMEHASQLFNLTSNLIPFLGNTSGNRASMGSRQMEQAISLVHREAPLVQVSSGVRSKDGQTFEDIVGGLASHRAPAAGRVTTITRDAIHLEGTDGKKHAVSLYDHYPLNDLKSVLHSTPRVRVGDHVSAGDTLADTNYSKNGTLALGTNLRVAYIPYKGYNFEDGIVISESAAKKLSSEHLHKPEVALDPKMTVSRRAFELEHPTAFSRAQLAKVSGDGIVEVGTKVLPGDPLVLATKPVELKDRTGLAAIRRSMSGSHTDKSLRWDSDAPGEVIAVHRGKDRIAVHVKTVEPMDVGDKMAGRYGNKGVVAAVLPDSQMPHTKDGPIDVALNPSGIPGRMNLGQVLEVAAGKIAEKVGKPYVVRNFQPGVDFREKIERELKAHGLSDQEELYDPVTKVSLGRALVGPQHMLKLVHQVDKKLSVRSGMTLPGRGTEHYDLNLQPSGGGSSGGQSMGTLGMYALLAHGARANIREMQTLKSEGADPETNPEKRWPSLHNAAWAAIQTGFPLPPPRPTFAFTKFTEMLKGAGINVEKHGHELVASPLTDKHILDLAKNALPKPAELLQIGRTGEVEPRPGGLFDAKLTGGHGGRKWSRIALAEPLPNPIFEGPICHLTGLKKADYDAIVRGEKSLSASGKVGPLGEGPTGGKAIEELLGKIEVPRALADAKRDLTAAKGAANVDKALKRVKYLGALSELGMSPREAYVLHHLPVMPPVMRPATVMPNGNLKYSDVNGLYSQFGQINEQLGDAGLGRHLTDSSKRELRADYYDGVKALMGVGVPYADASHKGILHTIAGAQPKNGFFQNVLMNRRQDLTMRSTIVPEPALGLDEVGLPRHAALDLFRPFVIRKLVDMGAAPTALDAPKLLAEKDISPVVWKALDTVMAERPVLMKRDPALHKYSVQAFKARVASGNAIQIHPLVTGGFNADFDGDTTSIYVPMGDDAVLEAHKMMPSRNLFAEATGKLMYQPTLESALGLYRLSLAGKGEPRSFAHAGEAIEAVRKGVLRHDDRIALDGRTTTPGRVLLAAALPTALQNDVLYNLDRRLDRKGLDRLLTEIAKSPGVDYGHVVNQLKDLGNGASFGAVAIPRPTSAGHGLTFSGSAAGLDPKAHVVVPIGTHSLGLADFKTDKAARDPILLKATKAVETIEKDPSATRAQRDQRAIQVWQDASAKMKEAHEKSQEANPSNLFLMLRAGVKPGWDQYQQMLLAPMLFRDSSGRTLPTPVTRSYAEGLDVAGYWHQMPGARRGSVQKVQEVQEPGYMSKLLMNNMMHMIVSRPDCGTAKGIALPITEADVHDRYLAEDLHLDAGKAGEAIHLSRGTILSPDVVAHVRARHPEAHVSVRSPLQCEEAHGLCQTCAGLSVSGQNHGIGTNLGVLAAHAVGERAIQLALKSFHTGGVVEHGGGSKLLNQFSRFEQLMKLPEKIPDAASIAMKTGKVTRVEPTATGVTVTIDGTPHHVGKDALGRPLHVGLSTPGAGYQPWKPPTVGMHIEAGTPLSDPNRTVVNPRDLFRATGSIDRVRDHLTSEVYGLYRDEGVRRRAIETVVRAMSDLTRVEDPGDDPHVLRGEFRSLSGVHARNRELEKEGLRPIEHSPTLKGVETMPLSLQEDWLAKLQHRDLRDTLMQAAATRGVSNIHSLHPVPAMAYGAEFGLNRALAAQPGRGHLANVPEHHY